MAKLYQRKRWTVYAFRRRAEPRRVYVGIATDLRGRLREHFRDEITEKPGGIAGAFARRVPKPLAILRQIAADTRITVLAWDLGRTVTRALELEHIERFQARGFEVLNVAVDAQMTASGKRVTGAPGRRARSTKKPPKQYPVGPVNPLGIFATARQRAEVRKRRELHQSLVDLLDPWADQHSEALPVVAAAVKQSPTTLKDGMEHVELQGAAFSPGGRGRGNMAKFTREGIAAVSIKDNAEKVELDQHQQKEGEQMRLNDEAVKAIQDQEEAAAADEDYTPGQGGDLWRSHTAAFGEADAQGTTINRRVEIAAVTLFKLKGIDVSLSTVFAWLESCRRTHQWPRGDSKEITRVLRRYDKDGRVGTTESREIQHQLKAPGRHRTVGRVFA